MLEKEKFVVKKCMGFFPPLCWSKGRAKDGKGCWSEKDQGADADGHISEDPWSSSHATRSSPKEKGLTSAEKQRASRVLGSLHKKCRRHGKRVRKRVTEDLKEHMMKAAKAWTELSESFKEWMHVIDQMEIFMATTKLQQDNLKQCF